MDGRQTERSRGMQAVRATKFGRVGTWTLVMAAEADVVWDAAQKLLSAGVISGLRKAGAVAPAWIHTRCCSIWVGPGS
jgi:hypothetical protein